MIFTALITGLFQLLIGVVSLILTPINALIINYLPSVDTALGSVNSLLSMVADSFKYAVSWTLLSPLALQLIVLYYGFTLVFPLSLYFIKLIVKWVSKIK